MLERSRLWWVNITATLSLSYPNAISTNKTVLRRNWRFSYIWCNVPEKFCFNKWLPLYHLSNRNFCWKLERLAAVNNKGKIHIFHQTNPRKLDHFQLYLDNLASYLLEYPNFKTQFSNVNIQLQTKKVVMPYEYLVRFEKFKETKLLVLDHCYNKLEDQKTFPRHKKPYVVTPFL